MRLAVFRPRRTTVLPIQPYTYTFLPHPLLPTDPEEVFAIEGAEAIIYLVQQVPSGMLCALKVCKPSYRSSQIARAAAAVAPYAQLPGLSVANRICLTRQRYPELLATFPDLEYAVLMPWIAGRTWAGFLADKSASHSYTRQDALCLALALAQVLWELEAHHLAHTDLAGGNLILTGDFKRVELLDIEGLYLPGNPAPGLRSRGTPGYQHRRLDACGQWCPEGDRFAGAILLTEMLTWWDPVVREQTPSGAESLFQPQELQERGSLRWQAVRNALWKIGPPLLQLFDQAWASPDLAACPELSTWAMALIQIQAKIKA